MKKILFLFLSVLMSFSLQAQSIDSLKLNQYFKKLDSTNKHMISAAIWKGDKIVYSNQTGFADVENNKKATADTKYRIGSISKSFTATMIMKAIEEGKLNLDTKLNHFFPQIKNSSQININHLLTHQSGLYNFTNDSLYTTYYTTPKSQEEMLELTAKYSPVFKPGEKHEYSNTNYLLLSYILEKIYNKPYKRLLEEKITLPLHLKNTFFGGAIHSDKKEAYSYIKNGEKWEKTPETDPSIPMGAGAIVSTPQDLLAFANALFNKKIISAKSLDVMINGQSVYKKGFFLMPFGIKKGFGHTGGIDGFTSVFVYFPHDNIGAAITSNGSNMNNNEILVLLLKAAYNMSFEVPDFKSFKVDRKDLKKYVGTYSAKNFPLKIIISLEGDALKAQATGQSSFLLEAKNKTNFVFSPAGIQIEFTPDKNQLTLKQAGKKFILTKE